MVIDSCSGEMHTHSVTWLPLLAAAIGPSASPISPETNTPVPVSRTAPFFASLDSTTLAFITLALFALIVAATYLSVRERRLREESYIRRNREVLEIEKLRRENELLAEKAGRQDTAPAAPREPDRKPPHSGPPIPDIPVELIDAIAGGQAILFTGFGLGVQAGLPSWEELLISLIARRKEADPSGEEAEVYDSALETGEWNVVAQLLEEKFSRDGLVGALRDLYRTSAEIPKLFRDLAALPFDQVFSFSWDDVLERAFRVRRPIIVTGDGSRLDDMRRNRRFAVLKLNGDLRDTESVRFSYDDYRNALFDNPSFAKTIATLTLDRTVFYSGTSIDSIRSFFSSFPTSEKPVRPQYALVPRERDMRSAETLLLSRYNVHLLPYTPSSGFPEVPLFIERLRQQVANRGPISATRERTSTGAQDLRISRVALTNIGPFAEIAVDLNPRWNLFLGINGAGKSTILKAMAMALCGDDPFVSGAGEQLLRAGADRGTITVTIGDGVCQTELYRERGRVRVVARRLTPLQSGSLVAMGFPALRAASGANPRGPAEVERAWPEIQDIAPLLDPSADRRLDGFKQWIVNIETRYKAATAPESRTKLLHVRDVAFAALRSLSGNTEIRFVGVETLSWRVLVSTRDVPEISLDQVSQGMTSLLAWIGVVVERLAEVYPALEKPELAPAVILVDEIDAHLHPQWQLELIGMLQLVLPNVQMIATTHSPLIVGALLREEIYVCRRSEDDPSRIEIVHPDDDVTGFRVDQILRSDAFELPATRNTESAMRIAEYEALVQSPVRTAAEEKKLAELGDALGKVLYTGETRAEIRDEQERGRIAADAGSVLDRFFANTLTDDERKAIGRALTDQTGSPNDAGG